MARLFPSPIHVDRLALYVCPGIHSSFCCHGHSKTKSFVHRTQICKRFSRNSRVRIGNIYQNDFALNCQCSNRLCICVNYISMKADDEDDDDDDDDNCRAIFVNCFGGKLFLSHSSSLHFIKIMTILF